MLAGIFVMRTIMLNKFVAYISVIVICTFLLQPSHADALRQRAFGDRARPSAAVADQSALSGDEQVDWTEWSRVDDCTRVHRTKFIYAERLPSGRWRPVTGDFTYIETLRGLCAALGPQSFSDILSSVMVIPEALSQI